MGSGQGCPLCIELQEDPPHLPQLPPKPQVWGLGPRWVRGDGPPDRSQETPAPGPIPTPATSLCPSPFPELISYASQISSAALLGTLTQSTFTVEQLRGQVSHLRVSDFETIRLVVRSHSGCCGGRPGSL